MVNTKGMNPQQVAINQAAADAANAKTPEGHRQASEKMNAIIARPPPKG